MTGIHRRIFHPSDYGQVRFVIEGFPGEIDAGDFRITVSPAGGTDGFDRYGTVRIAPGIARFAGDAPSVVVTSLPMALATGEYRATAKIEDREIAALFLVRPWKMSREESKIEIPLVDSEPRTLRVSAEITDADSDEDLTTAAVIEVLRGSTYVPLTRAGQLLSGCVFTFRIRVAGYPLKIIVVPVAKETGSVTISAEMETAGGNE